MNRLPIHSILPELLEKLHNNVNVILQAPPGAGKTTIVPIELLDQPWLQGRKIIVLEPRRLAARNAAERMAELLGEKAGQRVGYRMRQETKVSSSTRIEVVTEGVLTRMMINDPALEAAGILIFDEFHERSLQADLGLALALQSQALLREDLRVLVMSATLNAQALKTVMPEAPVVTSEGRAFPVVNRYLDIRDRQPAARQIADLVAAKTLEALKREEGSILVFLPGAKEIRRTEQLLRSRVDDTDVLIAPLYGALDKKAQRQAIAPVQNGRRKVVLATNIAETSLTIEGIKIVIDSGLERRVRYDSGSGMNRYETGMISRDSATQRAGRAGRTSPGVCYRLWHENRALAPQTLSEILSTDLAPMLLDLAIWGADVSELAWIDTPPAHAVEEARLLLISLNMINEYGTVTSHGSAAAALGMHPRLAHMLLRANAGGCGYEAALMATLLHEREFGRSETDLSEALEWIHGMVLKHEKTYSMLLMSLDRLMKKTGISPRKEIRSGLAGVLVALAYPDRIAMSRGGKERRYRLANAKGVQLRRDETLERSPFLAVAEVGGSGTEPTVFRAAALHRSDLDTWFADRIVVNTEVTWNEEQERVEGRKVERLGALVLATRPVEIVEKELVVNGLLEGIRKKGLSVLPWDKKSRALRTRVNFVNANLPGRFPDMDDEVLTGSIASWLKPYLEGFASLKALQSLQMYPVLSGMLSWEQMQELERLAPETITVPSGSKIRVDYGDPHHPILSVRLQEVFGWQNTPKILDGAVALTLHLLSPAQRPVQVTKDLASFWKEGYAEVRKELRGRYKKHYWPEDPYEAVPTSKTKKGMAKSQKLTVL